MTSRGRDNKPGSPSSDDEAPSGEEILLTSEDLFGDLLDRPPEPPKAAPPSPPKRTAARFPPLPRKGPIKVQVSEPGAARKAEAEPSRDGSEPLPEDLAALLDAFSEPAEAAERAAASALEALESEPALEAPEPAPFAPEMLLDEALESVEPPPPEPVASEEPAPVKAAPNREPEVDSLLDDMLPASAAAPPPAIAPSDPEDPLRDLIALQKMRSATPAPQEIEPPKSRTATKFQAASPKRPFRQDVSIDLAALAEEALGSRPGTNVPRPSAKTDPRLKPLRGEGEGEKDTYGPYRLLERVAVGGMAEVFRAKRSGVEGFEKVVAVKRILPHLSDNKEFVDMFIDEAKMVAGLTHPNIVQIFDLGKIEKSYYIAMEYVHGRDLRSILRRAKERGLRVPLDISAFVVNKLSSALEYAHRKKDENGRPMVLVHRDVSPQNILISFEGDVKLTDFGIAKAATKASITDRGALRGKLLYMSPEQAWGKPMDRRSDIFSLGIVFYEMLTDQKPFLGTSEMSILETVRECKVPPPTTLNPRITEKMERVVMKALERDPELRYQDAGELHRDLERVLHERQAPTAAGLARFMEILFDEGERGDAAAADWGAAEHKMSGTPAGFEVEFQEPTPPEPKEPAEPADPKDPMSIQKLLKRFGIK